MSAFIPFPCQEESLARINSTSNSDVRPPIRRQNLQISTMGHGKVQRIKGSEHRVHSSDPLSGLNEISVFDCRDLVQCMGHVGAEEFLNPLGILFRQFTLPHLLRQRRMQLDVGQPTHNRRAKRTKPLLGSFAEGLRAVISHQNAGVDVLGQYRSSSR